MTVDTAGDKRSLAQARMSVSPPCTELGMQVEAAGGGRCCITMPAAACLGDSQADALHSGALTVLIDTAAGVLAGLHLRGNATLDLRIDHVNPPPSVGVLRVDAEIATQSAQWVTIRSRVHAGDVLLAESVGTFIRRLGDQVEQLMHTENLGALEFPPPRLAMPDRFLEWLDIQDSSDEEGVYVLPYSRRIVGHPLVGHAHGGIIGAFLESAALLHLQRTLGRTPRSINTTAAFHRYAGAQPLQARVQLIRSGSRIAAVRVEGWQSGHPASTAQLTGHFLIADDPV